MFAVRGDAVDEENQAVELIIKDSLLKNQLPPGTRHVQDGAFKGAVGMGKNKIGENKGDQPSKPSQQSHRRDCLIEADAGSLHGGEFIVMSQSGEGEKNGNDGTTR